MARQQRQLSKEYRQGIAVDMALDLIEEVDEYKRQTGESKRVIHETALRRFLAAEAQAGRYRPQVRA